MSFGEVLKKYQLEKKGNFWRYLQLRDCIIKGKFTHETNPVVDFCEMPKEAHRAAVLYKMFNNLRKGMCENLRTIWQRDLGCTINKEEWDKILLNSCKFVKEAKGKFIQYKLIHRWYLTPSKLQRMGILTNDNCWKCHSTKGTFMHVIWECNKVRPFWEKVVDQIGTWIGKTTPKSPRLCLLGDKSVIPGVTKCEYVVIKVGVITAARVILSVWKDPALPEFNRWKENIFKIVSYEKLLARINDDMDNFDNPGGTFLDLA